MAFFQILISVIGRICLSGIFILGGVQKVLNWHDYEEVVTRTLCDWHVYNTQFGNIEPFLDFALSYVPVILGVIVFLELLGGLFVLFGIKARLGAFFLILFLVPATIAMHPFWLIHGERHGIEMDQAIKNGAILGGLLLVLAYGTGFPRRARFARREGSDK
ncbi:MAG: DoxX family protein [Simkaniaceae bacterium]|nr:DoxX family protein [Simkaniaceae bacterium]